MTFDEDFDPGYQAAYGMMIEVESHPFELDTMLFMDWRDDHTKVQLDPHATLIAASAIKLPFPTARLPIESPVHRPLQHLHAANQQPNCCIMQLIKVEELYPQSGTLRSCTGGQTG